MNAISRLGFVLFLLAVIMLASIEKVDITLGGVIAYGIIIFIGSALFIYGEHIEMGLGD